MQGLFLMGGRTARVASSGSHQGFQSAQLAERRWRIALANRLALGWGQSRRGPRGGLQVLGGGLAGAGGGGLEHGLEVLLERLAERAEARKVSGWPKRCKLAQAFLLEYS